MKRLLHKGVLILFSCLLLTGCWDNAEIERRAVVVAMAVDKVKDGFEVSIQVPNPRQIAGGGGGSGGGGGGGGGGPGAVEVYTGFGDTIQAAINDLDRQALYPLFFGHMDVILFGEAMAKQGINMVIDWLRRSPDVRRHLYPVVIEGKAVDALKLQPKLEQIPAHFLRHFIESGVEMRRSSHMVLGRVFINLTHPGKQVPMMFYFKTKEDRYESLGMAIFHKDKMVGSLSPSELNPVLHFREGRHGRAIEVRCPSGKGRLVFFPKEVFPKLTITNQPAANIEIKVKGNIIENTCAFKLKDVAAMKKADQLVARAFEQLADRVLKKAQRDFKADVFLISNRVYAFYPKIWERVNWEKEFPRFPVQIHYKVQVRRTGLLIQ